VVGLALQGRLMASVGQLQRWVLGILSPGVNDGADGLIAAVIDGGDGKGPGGGAADEGGSDGIYGYGEGWQSHRSLMVPTSARAVALVGLALQGRLNGFSRTAGKGGSWVS